MADDKKTDTKTNPAEKVTSAKDLSTQHEAGSVRDGSIANENLTPSTDNVPDINADPAGHAKAVGSEGETLDETNKDDKNVEAAVKSGQDDAKRNTKEEANLNKAANPEGREDVTVEDHIADAQKTAKENIAAERKAAKADKTLSPYL